MLYGQLGVQEKYTEPRTQKADEKRKRDQKIGQRFLPLIMAA